jgi:Trp operon repressor
MFDLSGNITVEEISKGYRYIEPISAFQCNECGKTYSVGEIYKFGERFFSAERAAREHFRGTHGDVLATLLTAEKKYTGCTEHQIKILDMMSKGMSDAEISRSLGIASATVRHQRFSFRERAKQAKLFLAIFELASSAGSLPGETAQKDKLLEIHEGATMIDERYCVTAEEEMQILETMFSSFEPLRLKTFPVKEKKKIVVLRRICQEFLSGREYSEKEINAVLKEIFPDFATIRRYLIEYGLMDRTRDGRAYWLRGSMK